MIRPLSTVGWETTRGGQRAGVRATGRRSEEWWVRREDRGVGRGKQEAGIREAGAGQRERTGGGKRTPGEWGVRGGGQGAGDRDRGVERGDRKGGAKGRG